MTTAALGFEAVTRRHRVGRGTVAVLDDASFAAWPGEIVAILAPRRSGKTTLLRIAAGVEAPDGGSVTLAGEELGALPAAERTRRLRRVGFAPKEWRVSHGKPVLDHVALPLLAERRPLVTALAKAHEMLERVGAGRCADAATDELAAGDLTRVALAQALLRNPSVLLVDEPGVTAEADERSELLRLLGSIAAERPQLALVMTARDVAGVAGAGRVLTLGEGQLRGATRPAEADVVPFPQSSARAAPVP
jgi:putative ABC transport system ATP-binding protein